MYKLENTSGATSTNTVLNARLVIVNTRVVDFVQNAGIGKDEKNQKERNSNTRSKKNGMKKIISQYHQKRESPWVQNHLETSIERSTRHPGIRSGKKQLSSSTRGKYGQRSEYFSRATNETLYLSISGHGKSENHLKHTRNG